jgi:Domain of unknown function (DUF4167)
VNNNFIRSNPNNNNKQRNRNRNRRNIGGSMGGGSGGSPSNKVFDSNGPDVKLRGTTQTIAEKYMQMGRDAQSSGDSVAAENYYQHAEHYYRLWAASQPVGHSLQMSRKLGEEEFDEDSSDENNAGDDEADAGNALEGAAAEGAPQTDNSAGGEQNNAQGDGQQQRPFRNNNYRDNNNSNRNQRPRWQNNRNNRNYDNRDNSGAGEQGTAAPSDMPLEGQQAAPEVIQAPAPLMAETNSQWEAPSFLQRPITAVEAAAPLENVVQDAVEDAPAPRKYRPRKPRVEADAGPDDGSGPTE